LGRVCFGGRERAAGAGSEDDHLVKRERWMRGA
jgi:hypothetical protein